MNISFEEFKNAITSEIEKINENPRAYSDKGVMLSRVFSRIKRKQFEEAINEELLHFGKEIELSSPFNETEAQQLEDFIKEQYNFPFFENGKIGQIYPSQFRDWVENLESSGTAPFFSIGEQNYQLLDNFLGNQSASINYEDMYSVASVSYFHGESLYNPGIKDIIYKDFILLPFAKETNGFDNYGFLSFISKLDGTSNGKIYYFDTNYSCCRISLVSHDFKRLLNNKAITLDDIFNDLDFINDFLANHKIAFDKKNKYSNWSLNELYINIENTQLNMGECHFKLNKMEDDYCFTNIYNSFTLIFSNNNKSYQLNCSFAYDDNINDWSYQKMYEGYYFYDNKDNAVAHHAEIKLRLKVILYDALHKIKDFLAENDINLLEILNDNHLSELEIAFTTPVEIDYYED